MQLTRNLEQVFRGDTVKRNGQPMTESKKRKVHLPEFKAKVGLEALAGIKNHQSDWAGVWGSFNAVETVWLRPP